MSRPTAWAAFYRIPKGWVLMVNTVRRTRQQARAAALGTLQGDPRTRMSDELKHGIRRKLAPVQITPMPHQSAADKRRERIERAQQRGSIPYRATVQWDHGTENIEGRMPLPTTPAADHPRRGPSLPSTR